MPADVTDDMRSVSRAASIRMVLQLTQYALS